MLSATGADAFLAREFNPGDLRNLWTLTPSGTVRFWSQWNKTSLPREPSTEHKAVEATLNPKLDVQERLEVPRPCKSSVLASQSLLLIQP
jgi:hypothetical protein